MAGHFYPADREELQREIGKCLGNTESSGSARPKALVAPHAGYIYSGAVAGFAYQLAARNRTEVRRVVLLGPNHRVPLRGIAAPSDDYFSTPLGNIPVDRDEIDRLESGGLIRIDDRPHQLEHSLEVHLPFLQTVLDQFNLIPLVVGDTPADRVARLLEKFWDSPGDLILVSSDLSHFHSYLDAQRIDRATTAQIENLGPDLEPEQACGCRPLNGLLHLARSKGRTVETLQLKNSGDTAGDKQRVVGYGAYAVI